MARVTINMPDAMSEFIASQIETGKYDNVSEYLRDLIRHDQERVETSELSLRKMLLDARKSGVSSDTVEDIFNEVKERLCSENKELRD